MRTLGIALILVLIFSAHSWAQSDENVQNCNSPDAKPDLTIQSCSYLIQSGKLSGADLSSALNNRGSAYEVEGNHELAIQDFNQSIGLNPASAKSLYRRGSAYYAKGDYDHAIQDYDETIRPESNMGLGI